MREALSELKVQTQTLDFNFQADGL